MSGVRRTELLAPAGDSECLHAAVDAGADAVYIGLPEFNARRNADNFTQDDFAAACDYAHLRGVRIYVTLNIEILPSELAHAVKVAADAWRAGADAFIVQDIGLARELRRVIPEVRMHASTQMNIHNAAGVTVAAELGMKRVTFARELSLAEVETLTREAADLGLETEVFAHGALCICYSGQCLMSSMIGGRSANRGLCAQACRLPYELHSEKSAAALEAPGEHLLSPRDLCTVDMLDELVDAGVASLKIEGRMKSPDYVHTVVGVYRKALDEALAGRESAVSQEQHDRLAEAFSRGFTTAYLTGQRGNDIMSYGRPNNRGVFIGRVSNLRDGRVSIDCERPVHEGDVLEFWTNRGHFSCPVDRTATIQGTQVTLAVEQRVGKGDRVFRVRNAQLSYMDEPFAPRIAVRGRVSARIGQPLSVEFTLAESEAPSPIGRAEGTIVEKARTKALTRSEVEEHIDRLGQTPFSLVHLDVDMDEGVGMGFSQLHRVRAAALEQLSEALLAPYRTRTVSGELPSSAIAAERLAAQPERMATVVAWATNPRCARAAKRAGAAQIYVPAHTYRRGQASYQGARVAEAGQAGYPKQCTIALPTIDHDPLEGTREELLAYDIWDYVKTGKPVYADSAASCLRAAQMGAQVEVGAHVPVTNEATLRAMADAGATRVWLSPELTLGQIAQLAQHAPVPLGLSVIGCQELMICEHCLLMSEGACSERCETCARREVRHWLVDRKEYDFPFFTDPLGRSHLYNGIELDIAYAIPDLLDAGVSSFMVDTTFMNEKQATDAVARVVHACELAQMGEAVGKRRGTTSGHLHRGVA